MSTPTPIYTREVSITLPVKSRLTTFDLLSEYQTTSLVIVREFYAPCIGETESEETILDLDCQQLKIRHLYIIGRIDGTYRLEVENLPILEQSANSNIIIKLSQPLRTVLKIVGKYELTIRATSL